LVVELASPGDEGPRGLRALRAKMAAYQANGARLGWLLLPHEQAVEATHEFPGLSLQLAEIWEG
jgi:Uma2 family endonuclease